MRLDGKTVRDVHVRHVRCRRVGSAAIGRGMRCMAGWMGMLLLLLLPLSSLLPMSPPLHAAEGEGEAAGPEAAPVAPTRAELDARIAAHRMGTLHLRGAPGEVVRVTQQRHAFPFGTAISAIMFGTWEDLSEWQRRGLDEARFEEDRARYQKILLENFNKVVLENAMKWPQLEREAGQLDYRAADRTLAWCEAHGLPMRGHCLTWEDPRRLPDWLKALDDAAFRIALRGHVRGMAARYRGRVQEWDVVNEMVDHTYLADRLGEGIRLDLFRWAQEGNPEAVLYLNDYSILQGYSRDRYIKQIRWFLDHGAPVGGIGCQGHVDADYDAGVLWETLERLAEFNLPIRITEFDIGMRWREWNATRDDPERRQAIMEESYGEAFEVYKAERVEEFYRLCFAHPSVNGILMWGFWRGRHWRPAAGFWLEDWSETPSVEAYRRLVFGEWWTEETVTLDAEGHGSVRVFYGTHAVSAGDVTRTVAFPSGTEAMTVDLNAKDVVESEELGESEARAQDAGE